jgi:poly(3-hydroxybutyrate) depolymerase
MRRRRAMHLLVWLAALSTSVAGQAQPSGQIIPVVTCAADPSQSYALYLPSGYSPARAWPVIFAFDPGGRGRTPVERYQAAAEQYGFIVAGSNNSRNGSPDTGRAVTAMANDVAARWSLDPKRLYTAGMSGGARVALGVALSSKGIAGVIASSAGYPDATPRKSLPFPVFATAGTEDFNHVEMRLLDRELTTPHRLVVFEGGHTWLSADLAVDAVEWLEIQAMRSGLKPKDAAEIDRIFTKRTARVTLGSTDAATFLAAQAIVADFDGLADVSAYAARAAVLGRDKQVKDALRDAREEDDREMRLLVDVRTEEARLAMADQRPGALAALRRTWKDLGDKARRADDSPDRRFARRVLAALSAGTSTTDADYLKIIADYRLSRR